MSYVQVHTVIDTAKAQRLRREAQLLRSAEQSARWLADQTVLANVYDDNYHPFSIDRSHGHWMSTIEFERRLAKLNPNFKFIWGQHSHKTHTKKLALLRPDGSLRELWPYEHPVMPERSIWTPVVQHVPPEPGFITRRADMPAMDWVPLCDEMAHLWMPNGRGIGKWVPKDPNALMPGWKKVTHRWGENLRGWRTILLKLYGEKILTREQIEREFASANTMAWQQGMDKASRKTLPWV